MTEERPYFELVSLKEKAEKKLSTFPYGSTEPKELGIRMFIDGYHECQKEHEWHDLEKDPNDLPKQEGNTCFSIDVLANNKKWVYYHFGYGKWFCGSEEVKVVAWKEIVFPKEIEK